MGLVLQLVETRADGGTRSVELMELGRPGNLHDIADLGLTLPEAKQLLACVQQAVVAVQARDHATLRPDCASCGERFRIVLHLATDADTGRIVASVLTDRDADDGSQVGTLLDHVDGPVASVTGDGAYDRDDVYTEVAARHPEAAVVVPPRANAVPSEAAETAPTQRDRHLRCIAERGRLGWQRASGYGWRALVEADISRWKRVIGDGLRSQTDGRQATEVAIAADVLNRMLELGRPEYVRIA